MKKVFDKRIVAIILSFSLIFANLPYNVFAESEDVAEAGLDMEDEVNTGLLKMGRVATPSTIVDWYAGKVGSQANSNNSIQFETGGVISVPQSSIDKAGQYEIVGTIQSKGLTEGFTLTADKGTVNNSEDSFVFYYTEVSKNTNFELETTAKITGRRSASDVTNQSGFGLLVKDQIRNNYGKPNETDKPRNSSSFVGVGSLYDSASAASLNSFYKGGVTNVTGGTTGTITPNVTPGGSITKNPLGSVSIDEGSSQDYNLKLSKEGNIYTLSASKSGDTLQSYTFDDSSSTLFSLNGENIYVGFFASRDLIVNFSDSVFIAAEASQTISATEVKISPRDVSMALGKTKNLTATFSPAGATAETLVWSSNDINIAQVDPAGIVTAKAVGTTAIKVTSQNNLTDEINVTVTAEDDFWYYGSVNRQVSGNKIAFGAGAPVTLNYLADDEIIGDASETGLNDTIQLEAAAGKMASDEDSFVYYYKPLSKDDNFVIKATAEVNKMGAVTNQSGFGILVKDQLIDNYQKVANGVPDGKPRNSSNYIGVGSLFTGAAGNKMNYFTKTEVTQDKIAAGVPSSAITKQNLGSVDVYATGKYDLILQKHGIYYSLTAGVNGEILYTETYVDAGNNLSKLTDEIYAGFFAARNMTVTFSDMSFEKVADISELSVDATDFKRDYLMDEDLDLSGLIVKADGRTLTSQEYAVAGFVKGVAGTYQLMVIHGNTWESIGSVDIATKECTNLEIQALPMDTDYNKGQLLDISGIEVKATYNNKASFTEIFTKKDLLNPNLFEITGFDSTTEGIKAVTVKLLQGNTAGKTTAFNVTISALQLSGVTVAAKPEKTVYYVGDTVTQDELKKGMLVYADYSDQTARESNIITSSDYTISGFDSSAAGINTLTLHHLGFSTQFDIEIREVEAVGLKILTYPKTNFVMGENFSAAGLSVAISQSNGNDIPLTSYELDNSNYSKDVAGIYDIKISVPGLETISYKVAVDASKSYTWQGTRFGQSTSVSGNVFAVNGNKITVSALNGAGKITEDQDGITYYYTELDPLTENFDISATVKVTHLANNISQQAFGIMARDEIGTDSTSSVFSSSMVFVGGYGKGANDGGTANKNAIAGFVRDLSNMPHRVLNISGEITEVNMKDKTYTLRLIKDNSGFRMIYSDGVNTNEKFAYTDEFMLAQDNSEKMYVGFFAAREAAIEVSDIQLTVTKKIADAPRTEAPSEAVTPAIVITSLNNVSQPNYTLKVIPNVKGWLTVKEGNTILLESEAVEAGIAEEINVTLVNEKTSFSVMFYPNTSENITTDARVDLRHSVTLKKYGAPNSPLYVSVDGSSGNAGTSESPLDIYTAINYVQPGQTVYVKGGTYNIAGTINIKTYNDGTPGAMKKLTALNGEKVIFDFGSKGEGFRLNANYWHITGIDVAHTKDNSAGIHITGSNNILEACKAYENGNTGIQMSAASSQTPRGLWPANNLILNCTSYENIDIAGGGGNADGFAAKLTVGAGNIFRGCISHNNSDDGWDLYSKGGTGAIAPVTIEYCITYNNGIVNGVRVEKGDGNGFKLGSGEGDPVRHVLENSLSFNNQAVGITSNSNRLLGVKNVLSFNNAGGNIAFTTYPGVAYNFEVDGIISYSDNTSKKDSIQGLVPSDNIYIISDTTKGSVNGNGQVFGAEQFVGLSLPDNLMFARTNVNNGNDSNIDWGNLWTGLQKNYGFVTTTKPTLPIVPGNPGDTDGNKSSSGSGNVGTPNQPSATVVAKVTDNKAVGTISQSDLNKLANLKKEFVEIVADGVIYTIPVDFAKSIKGLNEILKVNGAKLEDISFKITITTITPSDVKALFDKLESNNMKLAAKVIDFKVELLNKDGKSLGEIRSFEKLIKRTIELDSSIKSISPNFTCARYNEKENRFEFVPHTVFRKDSKYYVTIASNTNSIYVAMENEFIFDDVAGHWSKAFVAAAASKFLVTGEGQNKFMPEAEISRAKFVQMMVNLLNLPEADKETKNYSDIQPKEWYYDAILKAKETGILAGLDTSRDIFNPDQSITREEMSSIVAAIINRSELATTLDGIDLESLYHDYNEIDDAYKNSFQTVVKLGIITGISSSELSPKTSVTKAQAAVVQIKLAKVLGYID